MVSSTSRSTGTPLVAMAACAAFLLAVAFALTGSGGGTTRGPGTPTRLVSTTVGAIPPAVHTDLKEARADLTKLDAAIAGEEKQEKAAKSELATLEKKMEDHTLSSAAGGTVGSSGADDLSAAIAGLFSSHGQEYQALTAQVVALHEAFVQALSAAGSAYQAAEAATPTP
jgi:hypothetical protein